MGAYELRSFRVFRGLILLFHLLSYCSSCSVIHFLNHRTRRTNLKDTEKKRTTEYTESTEKHGKMLRALDQDIVISWARACAKKWRGNRSPPRIFQEEDYGENELNEKKDELVQGRHFYKHRGERFAAREIE